MMEKYKYFRGGFKKHANQLIYDMFQEGYIPQSTADIMKNRILDGKQYPTIIVNGSDTIDAIAYNKHGDAKIILDSQHILTMNYQTEYSKRYCCLPLKDEEFEELSGSKVLFVSKERLNEIEEKRHYSIESVKESKEWNFLARNHKNLSEYVEFITPIMTLHNTRFTLEKNGAFELSRISVDYGDSELPLNMLFGISIGGAMHISAIQGHDLFNGTNQYISKKKDTI